MCDLLTAVFIAPRLVTLPALILSAVTRLLCSRQIPFGSHLFLSGLSLSCYVFNTVIFRKYDSYPVVMLVVSCVQCICDLGELLKILVDYN